jgi:phosphoglycolate phosphatase
MTQTITPRCNICGGTDFLDMPGRPKVRCAACGSLERARVCALHIAHTLALGSGSKVLHFAPERGLQALLRDRVGAANYRAVDIAPGTYPGLGVQPFDLCRDVFSLPERAYDLIVMNHVLEHIECNYSAVLLRLARALTGGGALLFSVPIDGDDFWDHIVTGSPDEKAERFGPFRHYRNFGRAFIGDTFGMLFRMPERYDLLGAFTEEDLVRANIRPHHWRKFTGASVFVVRRQDVRI